MSTLRRNMEDMRKALLKLLEIKKYNVWDEKYTR